MEVAIDHGSVFHGVLHLDQKCEGHDSFKKGKKMARIENE